jgi:hypothetical protein
MKKKQYFQSTEQKKRKVTHTVAQEYSPVPTAAEQRSLPVMAPTAAPVPAWQQSKGPHQLWHPQRHQLLLQQSKVLASYGTRSSSSYYCSRAKVLANYGTRSIK